MSSGKKRQHITVVREHGLAGGLLSRREAMRLGLYGAAGAALVGGGAARALAAAAVKPRPAKAKAKSVIQIWVWGGPAHLDTFDPKPGLGNDYNGPLDKAIPTNVDGVRVGQLLPMLAQHADKTSHGPRRGRCNGQHWNAQCNARWPNIIVDLCLQQVDRLPATIAEVDVRILLARDNEIGS